MSRHYTVSLPVKPYIKKYIQTIEGSPIQFKGNSILCMLIRAYLENKPHSGYSRDQLASSLTARPSTIDILVPMSKIRLIGFEIDPSQVVLINRFLEARFKEDLRRYIDKAIRAGGRYKGYKEAYEAFADAYGIVLEEDISYDGLKQIDFRSREAKKEEKICSNPVPSQNNPSLFSVGFA